MGASRFHESCRIARAASIKIGSALNMRSGILSKAPIAAARHYTSPGAAVKGCLALLLLLAVISNPDPVIGQKSRLLSEAIDYHKIGDVKQAIDVYSEEIKKNPDSADAYNLRGLAYVELGKFDEALADYSQAIKISPEFADALNNRGDLYRRQKKYREALGDFAQAIKYEKDFAEPHYNMALTYEAMGQIPKALQSYQEYLKVKPGAEDKDKITAKIQELQGPAKPGPPKPGPATAAKPETTTPGKPETAPATKPTRPPLREQPPKKAAVQPTGPSLPGLPPGIDPNELMRQIPVTPETIKTIQDVLTGLGAMAGLIPLILWIFVGAMLFLTARKSRTPAPWLGFVPILNVFLILSIARKPAWWFLLFLLPAASVALPFLAPMDPTEGILPAVLAIVFLLVPVIAYLAVCLGIARMRGKSAVWGILLWIPCTSIFALAYLGLSR